jgi:geranylgeranyl pyrophosphate synthase
LIIDDIEDDSPMRRGEESLHRRVGVPVALNTGNWMYFLPLALLARMDLADEVKLALYVEISDALVLCHKGQALDLSARVTNVRQAEMPPLVEQSTRLKTGSLMRLAAMLAGRAARADRDVLAALGRFATAFGVGLQMLDDWSGIAVDTRRHKGMEDIKLGRPTWPWAWLAQSADEITYAALLREARSIRIDWEVERLLLRLRSRLARTAPGLIHAHLQEALAALESALGPSAALDELKNKVRALETAYG